MAEYKLHLSEEKSISLSAAVVRRLIDCGSGDGALLYLCLVKNDGALTPEKLMAELRWDAARLCAAEQALCAAGLISAAEHCPAPAPKIDAWEDRPSYSREDVADKLEQDTAFNALLREVERKLGPLSHPSVSKLLGLYEHLGLGADVIFLLVSHCIARAAEHNTRPTMRQIEQEGYAWARRGITSTAAANEYLKREGEKRSVYAPYLAALQIMNRKPTAGEEKYLSTWAEMGFKPEAIAIAYDKTVLKCHEFKWAYCNGILKKWHEKGLHSAEEVLSEGRKESAATASGRNDWMKQYM